MVSFYFLWHRIICVCKFYRGSHCRIICFHLHRIICIAMSRIVASRCHFVSKSDIGPVLASSSSSAPSSRCILGQHAQPCAGWDKCILVDCLTYLSDDFMLASCSKVSLELKVAEATRAKACILEFVNNVRKACSELQSAMTAAKDEEKKQVAAVTGTTSSQPVVAANGKGVFAFESDQHEIVNFTEDELNGIIEKGDDAELSKIFSSAFIVRNVSWVKQEWDHLPDDVDSLKSSVDGDLGLMKTFKAAKVKERKIRVAGNLGPTCAQRISEAFCKSLPPKLQLDKQHIVTDGQFKGALDGVMVPQLYAYAALSDSNSFEKGHLPSFRFSLRGSRKVAVARFGELGEYVKQVLVARDPTKKAGSGGFKGVSSSQVSEFFFTASKDEVQGACATAGLRFGTVGPFDGLHVPTAVIPAVQVGQEDVVGVRCSYQASLRIDPAATREVAWAILDSQLHGGSPQFLHKARLALEREAIHLGQNLPGTLAEEHEKERLADDDDDAAAVCQLGSNVGKGKPKGPKKDPKKPTRKWLAPPTRSPARTSRSPERTSRTRSPA